MLKPRKRITKREIKEDQLVTTYFEARSWYSENKRLVNAIVTGLIVLVVAVIVINNNIRANNEKATTELGKIMPYYDRNEYEAAIKGVPQQNIRGLEAIVADYGSTRAGTMARFLLANSYFAQGEFETALTHYLKADISDPLLRASALAGAAACYEAMGNHTAAAETFEKASLLQRDNPQAADYLHQAAVNYGAAGQRQKAVELLKRLKREYPTSTVARDADRFIAYFSS